MTILGISAYYHDSSAALLIDDKIVAAAQEERFTRVKHDRSFPAKACRYCLEEAGLSLEDIDAVVFYEKPFIKFERILVSSIATFPKSCKMFLKVIPIWLKEKLNMRRLLSKELKKVFGATPKAIKFAEHHLSHAAFAYCASGYEEADILVVDAVGEWATTSIMRAKGASMKAVEEQTFPDSIGLLYSSFTQYLGFKVNSDEYKVMGLAPYGEKESCQTQEFIRKIETVLIQNNEIFPRLNLSYFSFQYGERMIEDKKWEQLFAMPVRHSNEALQQAHKNLALAIQTVTETILQKIIEEMKSESISDNLCICGGVALNCAANGNLDRKEIYSHIYVPFAPGDCGCAIGAALAYSMLVTGNIRYNISPYIGPEFSKEEILKALANNSLDYIECSNEDDLCNKTAVLIAEGAIIGWFQGRMELGPRALGNRSILADARRPEMKDMVNSRIKFRESFRPFAPSVMAEYSHDYFAGCGESPFMMFTYPVRVSTLPAITHVDSSARIQTVSEEENALYYRLLKSFYNMTGCPVILNTSFNVMGEPIVCTPQDAINTFKKSGLDYLVIGNFIVRK